MTTVSSILHSYIFQNKALLHKERTWPTNLSGSMTRRQDDGRLCSSPATHRKFAWVSKCACVYHLLCAREIVCHMACRHICVFTCVCLCVAEPFSFYFNFFSPPPLPQTVLSSIHSVLLNVTLLLASGDDSVLSWLVDLCHLVLALRG